MGSATEEGAAMGSGEVVSTAAESGGGGSAAVGSGVGQRHRCEERGQWLCVELPGQVVGGELIVAILRVVRRARPEDHGPANGGGLAWERPTKLGINELRGVGSGARGWLRAAA